MDLRKNYNMEKIKQFLLHGFSESELRGLSLYNPAFYVTRDRLSDKSSKVDIVAVLTTHAIEEDKMPELLAWAKKNNPNRYRQYEAEFLTPEAPDKTPTDYRKAVILTALPLEYNAVRVYLTDLKEIVHKGTIYEEGIFQGYKNEWKVGLTEFGMGNVGASTETERAISYFDPGIVLFVGIAGGIKDVLHGDVVAATEIYAYESGKDEETFKVRPKAGHSAYPLIQRARAEARKKTWLKRLNPEPARIPGVQVAPMVAGEKVVANKGPLFNFIRNTYNDAIAVDMEGYGFLRAVEANRQQALVIRGISDLIDDKTEENDSKYQKIAAEHASAFAFEVLAKL